jgi:predicted RNA methylase
LTTRPYTFARHGARTFIALGPLPNAASCAEENVNISGLTDVAFVMGNALLSHLPVSPKGRSIIGRLAEGVCKGLRRQKS